MSQLFAVTRCHSAAWLPTRPLEAQRDWHAHADFMIALHREAFVLLAGPLEGTDDVLLIVRAEDPDEIKRRLAANPWSDDLLRIARILPWSLRLGACVRCLESSGD